MSEHDVREGGGYQQLKDKLSLEEILTTAALFEKTAWDFYASLGERVGKPLRPLVAELAQEEERHFQLFTDLRQRPDVQVHMTLRLNAPESDHRFSDYVHVPDLAEFPDDQAILQYAMGREQAAMEQYTALAEQAPEGSAKETFLFLAAEELAHKKELEKIYYDLIHLNFS